MALQAASGQSPGSALANERVQINAAGQVVLKLVTPWRNGTTHLEMSPLEFMQRLTTFPGPTFTNVNDFTALLIA